MGLYNVYTLSGSTFTQVAGPIDALNDRDAVMKSQSAAGTYYAFDSSIPKADVEAALVARKWPADEAVKHVLVAAQSAVNGTLTAGSRSITSIGSTAAMAVGQKVSGPGVGLATIVSIDSGTAITIDRPADNAGVTALNYAEMCS